MFCPSLQIHQLKHLVTIYLCICLSVCLSIYLYIYLYYHRKIICPLNIYQSFYLSSIYLGVFIKNMNFREGPTPPPSRLTLLIQLVAVSIVYIFKWLADFCRDILLISIMGQGSLYHLFGSVTSL